MSSMKFMIGQTCSIFTMLKHCLLCSIACAGHLFVSLRIEPPEMDEADTVPCCIIDSSIFVLGISVVWFCLVLCGSGHARRPPKSSFGRQEDISCAKDAKNRKSWKRNVHLSMVRKWFQGLLLGGLFGSKTWFAIIVTWENHGWQMKNLSDIDS